MAHLDPLFPDVNTDTLNVAGAIVMYVMITLDGLLGILCLLIMIHAVITVPGWHIVKLLKILLPWPILARCISMLLSLDDTTAYMISPIADQTSVFLIFTSGSPGYLLFSVFFLLVLFWVHLFHLSSAKLQQFVKRLLLTYLAANILVYFIWFALLILMVIYPAKLDTLHMVEGVYAASLSVLVSIAFCLYGTRILLVLKKRDEIDFITKRISLLTVVCTILFLMRSIVILLNEFLFTSHSTGLLNLFGITFNMLFCEFMPILFILLVLCWPTHRVAFSELGEDPKYPESSSYSYDSLN